MPCGEAAVTRIGRGGQFWLSMCETQVRKAMTWVICSFREPRVGHHPSVALLGIVPGRILEKLPQVGVAPMLRDLRQIRRVIGALAEQRVAVDAVLAVPHVLARDHIGRDRVRVRQLGESRVAVDGQCEEDEGEDRRARNEEEARLPSGHAHLEAAMRRHSPRRCSNNDSAIDRCETVQTPMREKLPIPIQAA